LTRPDAELPPDAVPQEPAPQEHAADAVPPEPAANDEPATSAKSDSIPQPAAPTRAAEPTGEVRLFGTVTDLRTGSPIADASIKVIDDFSFDEADFEGSFDDDAAISTSRQLFSQLTSNENKTVQTDASGAFSIQVSSDTKRLGCGADGYAGASLRLSDLKGDTRVDFQLVPEAVVAGRVVDQNDEGVEGVAVTAKDVRDRQVWFDPEDFASGDSSSATLTESDGRFSIVGLAPGNYQVVAEPGEKGYLFDRKRAPVINVDEGEHFGDLVLMVTPGGLVAGTVRDSEGKPVADAEVMAIYHVTDFENVYDVFGEHLAVSTEADGTYAIRAIQLGSNFHVAAQHDDLAAASSGSLSIDDPATPITVDLVMTKGSRVSGVVVDPTGNPAHEIDVMLTASGMSFVYDPTAMNWEESGEDGAFVFNHVSPGLYTLEAEDATMEVHVLEGRDVTGLKIAIDETPVPDASLEGIVLGLDGAPEGGVRVSMKSLVVGYTVDETVSAEDGTFTLADVSELVHSSVEFGEAADDFFVPPALFELRAQSEDGIAIERNIVLGRKITMRLRQAVHVSGIVLTADGEPASRCPVSLVKEDADDTPFGEGTFYFIGGPFGAMFGDDGDTTTDESGQFTFKNVDPGAYSVEAISKTQGAGVSTSFSVTETAGHDNITVKLERGVSFAGQVTGPDGQPISGALVELYRSKGEGAFAEMAESMFAGMFSNAQGAGTTDGQGRFAIQNVPHGTYQVRATHARFAPFVGRGVTLSAGHDTSGYAITLSTGGGVRGTVSHSGVPTAGAMVMLSNADAMKQTTTDSQGRFEVSGLPAGTYMVMSIRIDGSGPDEDAMPRTQSVTVVADQISEVEIATGIGFAVSGTVTGATTAGENMMVRLVPEGAEAAAEEAVSADDPMSFLALMDFANMSEVEEDGTFSLPDMNPGTYTLEVFVFTPELAATFAPDFEGLQDVFSKPVHTQSVTIGNEPVTVDVALP
jgi:protocatechuate 3,4-dioxygenase beta subunit